MLNYRIKSIKGKNNFTSLLEKGRKFFDVKCTAFVIFGEEDDNERATGEKTIYLGVSISKRTARKAVVRNRIRRLMRESMRTIARRDPNLLTGISKITFFWKNAPSHPKLIGLEYVAPIIKKILENIQRNSRS
jgi:ribonuclease P protein component